MKAIILTHDNAGIFYTQMGEDQMTQEEADKEMAFGPETRPRPTPEELAKQPQTEGPF